MAEWLLLALVGCRVEPAAWSVPAPVEPLPEHLPWEPDRIAISGRGGQPIALRLQGGALIAAAGGQLRVGELGIDTPGWASDAVPDGEGWLVADGRNGLIRLQRSGAPERVAEGTAVSIRGDRALIREGWLLHVPTGERVALDGGALWSVRVRGERWAVSDMAGALILGEGNRVLRTLPIRARIAAPDGEDWVVWTLADTLERLDGTVIATAVTGLVDTDPPTWSSASEVFVLGRDAPIHARPEARVVRLDGGPEGALVAWSDGRIEAVGADGATEVGRWSPGPPPWERLDRQGPLTPSREGLVHDDWPDPVPVPYGLPVDRVMDLDGWSVGMNRESGGLVAVSDEGAVLRRVLPAMANDAVRLGELLVVSTSAGRVAGIPLDRPDAPIQWVDAPGPTWTGLCASGDRALLVSGDVGAAVLQVEAGQMRIREWIDTPGRAQFCRPVEGGWEVHDQTAIATIRY